MTTAIPMNAGMVSFSKVRGMITYPALSYPLPREVQSTLKMLGQHSMKCRGSEDWEDSFELLEKYEMKIRAELGQILERQEIRSRGNPLM